LNLQRPKEQKGGAGITGKKGKRNPNFKMWNLGQKNGEAEGG